MNIHGLSWANCVVQTRTEPARSGFSWNRYNRNSPKTEPLLTLYASLLLIASNSQSNTMSVMPSLLQTSQWRYKFLETYFIVTGNTQIRDHIQAILIGGQLRLSWYTTHYYSRDSYLLLECHRSCINYLYLGIKGKLRRVFCRCGRCRLVCDHISSDRPIYARISQIGQVKTKLFSIV